MVIKQPYKKEEKKKKAAGRKKRNLKPCSE